MFLKTMFVAGAILVGSQGAYAQFGMPSIPGVTGGGGGASTANAADTLKNANIALNQFIKAEFKMAEALGQYVKNAETEALLKKIGKGDLADSDEDVKAKVAVQETLKANVDKGIEENKKLDPAQKKLFAEGALEYFKGLLASKKLVDSLQSLAKNPMAISPSSLGPLTTMAGNLPGVVKSAASSSGTLISYMTTQGLPVDGEKKLMAQMDK